MNLIELARLNEDEAREYMERIRWPNGPVCPHCESTDATRLQGEASRPGTLQCNACREQFTVTVGSVMESSHIPLVKWCMAFHLMCSSKKGISALQLKRELSLGSYRTAWFMCHRVRLAMEGKPMKTMLQGVVEADETYIGARKPRVKGQRNPESGKLKRGRGTDKAPVAVLVERDGSARCKPLERVTAANIRRNLIENVDTSATLMTDEFRSYVVPGRDFAAHETVKHRANEYARLLPSGLVAHCNTAESFFALIKRGHYGVFHQMSKKHLHRYCAEFSFRWDYRKVSDAARTDAAIAGAAGKRLMYKTSSAQSTEESQF